jgi:hypothetical protein
MIKVTSKHLRANRANARKSTGPSSAWLAGNVNSPSFFPQNKPINTCDINESLPAESHSNPLEATLEKPSPSPSAEPV